MKLSARVAAAFAVVALLAGCTMAPPAPPTISSATDALPQFTGTTELTVPGELEYNPTGEFIFPSVFHAGAHIADPLGEWYLYYAPHESPGGISMMYANDLDGPWTEYADNPIISATWAPFYSVSHVSSPDIEWVDGEAIAYFHGENSVTRWATSADGLHFTNTGEAVRAADFGAEFTEASYARVTANPNSSSEFPWVMVLMVKDDGPRRIGSAYSRDGLVWEDETSPLFEPSIEGADVSGSELWSWHGSEYLLYHGSGGSIWARSVSDDLTDVGDPVKLFSSTTRSAAPDIVEDGGSVYLFYESGTRLGATIRVAKSASSRAG